MGIITLGKKIPSKSKLHELQRLILSEIVNKMIDLLSVYLSSGIASEYDFSANLGDSTYIELEIYHPIGWVLLKDAVISIMKSVKMIKGMASNTGLGPQKDS